ncbi:hypothetical protein [Ideonella sp. A 288]|uniref:hypothetical protein n=1 Tax=Ideonella sp. A 288 TaxID=1962181 RepID=UPI000B4A9E14|nr:hypothetical protein [Ideonella sp. A 288]
MSRWWGERLRIGLAPDRVDLAWLRLGPRRAVDRARSLRCAPKAGEPAWQAAIEALGEALPEFGVKQGAAAVVLSNHWVRYAVLPWQAELTGAAEVDQRARLHFEQTYGSAAIGWTVRTRDTGFGAPHLACAVDTALIDALGATLAGHGLGLGSLQPLLIAAFNDQRKQLSGQGAFAVVEAGRVCLGLMQQQRWHDITSRRTDADAAEVIEQELSTLDADLAPTPLDVLLVGEDVAWTDPARRPARLLGAADGVGRPTLALCGIG